MASTTGYNGKVQGKPHSHPPTMYVIKWLHEDGYWVRASEPFPSFAEAKKQLAVNPEIYGHPDEFWDVQIFRVHQAKGA